MLGVLRRIRRSLLNEGQLRKYLVYALGEIILVVAGILIALAINSWWAGVQAQKEAMSALVGLRNDFILNYEEAQRTIQVHQERAKIFSRFSAMSADEITSISEDSVGFYIHAFYDPKTFDPVLGSINALIGGGKLGLVGNETLQVNLTSILNQIEDLAEESERLRETSLQIWKELSTRGGPWKRRGARNQDMADSVLPEASWDDLNEIHGDADLMGLIRLNQFFGLDYASSVAGVVETTESIISQIDESDPGVNN